MTKTTYVLCIINQLSNVRMHDTIKLYFLCVDEQPLRQKSQYDTTNNQSLLAPEKKLFCACVQAIENNTYIAAYP